VPHWSDPVPGSTDNKIRLPARCKSAMPLARAGGQAYRPDGREVPLLRRVETGKATVKPCTVEGAMGFRITMSSLEFKTLGSDRMVVAQGVPDGGHEVWGEQ